jgi:thioredoxin 1
LVALFAISAGSGDRIFQEEKMSVKKITDDTYTEEISKGYVLIDFWAEWCGPCRLIAPIIEELSVEMPDVSFGKMNVDENQNAPQTLGITAIPTLVLYKNGEVVEKIVGMLPKPQLKKKIEKYIHEG